MSLDASCASVECLTVSTACRYARTLVTSADGQSDPYCFFVASKPLTTYFRHTAIAVNAKQNLKVLNFEENYVSGFD